jgi:dephospho-CoA kinase
MPQETTRLGLTGGIGSGKSTVAGMFAALGAIVIDADAISRSLTAPYGAAIQHIGQQFGKDVIHADGGLDRQRMRDLVFADATVKKNLEAIIHPLIKLEIEQQNQAAVARGAKLIVYDIPLLVESSNWRPVLNQVLVVDCLEQTQTQRVMARSALTQADVQKIIANQACRKMRNCAADILIFNDSISTEQLRLQVNAVAQHLEHAFDEWKKL